MRLRLVAAVLGVLVSGFVAYVPAAAPARQAVRRPGPAGSGDTLLPNGWRIAPAGRHLPAGDLPLTSATWW
jgi:hypothetical protein